MKTQGRKNLLFLCAFAATAVMLTVIQPPIGWSVLAWVAYVPFILICCPQYKLKVLLAVSYLVAAVYWLGNLYWIVPVTISGWVAFCLYTALLWPILVLALRYCRAKKIPLFLAVPVLVVGAERLQGLFLGGFFWRHLSHSQYANITLIQLADIFGAAGLSFLIAMVNGLVAELLIAGRKNIFKISQLLKTALVFSAVVAAFVYGRYRINQSDEFIIAGPPAGAVQSNVPQSVKQSSQAADDILDDLLDNSSAAAKAGAELLVWPETMVQSTLDARVLRRLSPSYHCKVVDERLRKHSKETGCFVLVGAYGAVPLLGEDLTVGLAQRYNSAFLYNRDGTRADRQYDKIHLVPFGEVVPFKNSCPWLYNLLMKFTPYDYDYSLDAGSEYTVFEMTADVGGQSRVYKFGVMICYEDAVPEIARRFAIDDKGRKRLDWLVNISNDGWFVKFEDGKTTPSTELSQHTAVCVFRAVENRLSVLRSVNAGISCLIDPVGRVKNGFLAGTLPNEAMARTACAGWFVDKVPIDGRTTFFSSNGQWLDLVCAIGLVLLVILQLSERFVRNKKCTEVTK